VRGVPIAHCVRCCSRKRSISAFTIAIRLDPTFAPYAGLSFTHFQDAFFGWRARDAAIELAYGAASQGLMADEHDPAAHWALGRAMWLRNRQDEALRELHAAVELSPNFAWATTRSASCRPSPAMPKSPSRRPTRPAP